MGRKPAVKGLPLYVERILLEFTDEGEGHTLSVAEIKNCLNELYDISVDAASIRDTITALKDFYDSKANKTALEHLHKRYCKDANVEHTFGQTKSLDTVYELEEAGLQDDDRAIKAAGISAKNSKKLYHLVNEKLELGSLKHIIALLNRASHAGNTKNLVDDLLATRSYYERISLRKDAIKVTDGQESVGLKLQTTLFNIEVIESAIRQHHLIDFSYRGGDSNYIDMVPYHVDLDDGYYYLYCKKLGNRKKDLLSMRVDEIDNLKVKELEDARRWPGNYEAMQEKARIWLRGSINRMPPNKDKKLVLVTLRCHSKADEKYVLDNFGDKEEFRKLGESDYQFKASFDGMKYWVLKHVSSYEVVKPLELREAIINEIKNNCYGLKVDVEN